MDKVDIEWVASLLGSEEGVSYSKVNGIEAVLPTKYLNQLTWESDYQSIEKQIGRLLRLDYFLVDLWSNQDWETTPVAFIKHSLRVQKTRIQCLSSLNVW